MHKKIFFSTIKAADAGMQSSNTDNEDQSSPKEPLKQTCAHIYQGLDILKENHQKHMDTIKQIEKEKKDKIAPLYDFIKKQEDYFDDQISKENDRIKPSIDQLKVETERLRDELYVIKYYPDTAKPTESKLPGYDEGDNEIFPDTGKVVTELAPGKTSQDEEVYKAHLKVLSLTRYPKKDHEHSCIDEDMIDLNQGNYRAAGDSFRTRKQLTDETVKLRRGLTGALYSYRDKDVGVAPPGTNPEDVVKYKAHLRALDKLIPAYKYSFKYYGLLSSKVLRDLESLRGRRHYPDFIHDDGRENITTSVIDMKFHM